MYSGYNITAQWFGYPLLAWEVMVLKPSWTTIQGQKKWYDQELVSQLGRSSVYVNIHFLFKKCCFHKINKNHIQCNIVYFSLTSKGNKLCM